MKEHFNIQQLGDLSGKDCVRYTNLFFPFGNLPDPIKPSDESGLLMSHMDLMNKYASTQNKINEYIDFRKASMLKINNEMGEYLKTDFSQNTIPTLNWTNPSYKLKNDFIEIIELCALRLQDLARLCLQITGQPTNILQKPNLVVEYEKLLEDRHGGDIEFMQLFQEDHKRIKMIKELRNEAGRHQGGDRNGRELVFHDVKIDFSSGGKPLLHIPAFDFIGSEGDVRIDDFELFFDVLTHNIFELSIDRLAFAYAKKSNFQRSIIKMMVKSKWIEEQN